MSHMSNLTVTELLRSNLIEIKRSRFIYNDVYIGQANLFA